jgi:hypothetical protein
MSRVEGPSDDRQGEIAVGVEVQPGKNTGSLKVFDGGVANFPATFDGTAGGFTTLSIAGASPYTSGEARTLDELVSLTRGGTDRSHLKWKRSITFYADAGNVDGATAAVTVYIGDRYTDASASPKIGFPLVPGASLTLEITEGSAIYLDRDGSGGTILINWIAV